MDKDLLKADLNKIEIDKSLLKEIPLELVKQHNCFPLFKMGKTITFAIESINDIETIDALQNQIKTQVDVVSASKKDIEQAINKHYGLSDNIEKLINTASKKEGLTQKSDEIRVDITKDNIQKDAQLINIANNLIKEAIHKRASDIHIEPEEKHILLRYRIDGEMIEIRKIDKKLQSSLNTRIKVMCNMDIAESRIPQDSNIKIKINDQKIDLRVSTLPTLYGENIVMRITGSDPSLINIDAIGLNKKNETLLKKILSHPQGILLVTGPTGSGKTTTLYASLNHINRPEKNIITLEDPIENEIERLRQVQINEKKGLTFSIGLRSILRQDPDIIMLGEIRDLETAQLAIRASLTGHLVLSTLHTNDAPSTVIRLIDMGIDPFLVSSSLTGVIAQRLVRKICQNCKAPYKPDPEALEALKLSPNKKYIHGKGCPACDGSGFLSRVAIYEFLLLDQNIKQLISTKVSTRELTKVAKKQGLISLKEDGIDKINQELTTPEEILKVISSSEG